MLRAGGAGGPRLALLGSGGCLRAAWLGGANCGIRLGAALDRWALSGRAGRWLGVCLYRGEGCCGELFGAGRGVGSRLPGWGAGG